MIDSQLGAQVRVGYSHLMNNKLVWNNFFIKTTPNIIFDDKILSNLPCKNKWNFTMCKNTSGLTRLHGISHIYRETVKYCAHGIKPHNPGMAKPMKPLNSITNDPVSNKIHHTRKEAIPIFTLDTF